MCRNYLLLLIQNGISALFIPYLDTQMLIKHAIRIVRLGQKGSSITMMTHNRKVLEKIYSPSNVRSKGEANGNVSLEDYSPIDPVPISKAAIKSAPIQHGTPLMPYIPKPPTPRIPPKQGVSPAPA
ncbi:hypothetical protein MKW94_006616 [Papaver nudicaule]|uniref:Uncharacterized protein n=1 Tax=Papaver nudicaule TaxID=74823 RepID=A0AA41S915_PAPNU|nr:hypothetical protein [Papaver nudicaule]